MTATTGTSTHPIKGQRNPFTYLLNILRDPFVGSIAPSSEHLCKAVSQLVPFHNAHTIIELGAGDGVLTEYLLDQMRQDTKLITFESNPRLVHALHNRLDDDRVEIVAQDAEKLEGWKIEGDSPADVVISGLPISFFSKAKAQAIMRNVFAALKPNGIFISYQTFLPPFSTGKAARRAMMRCFQEVSVENVYMNLPPLKIIVSKPRTGMF